MDSKLEIIRRNVIECTKCELCKTRTNSVPGKGNFQSDVIFVGEAPGRNEDQLGEPFVGIAGQRLVLALQGAGISRESVYITNVVKCRPPNNRVPTISERNTCRDYLQKEISIIKPKIIFKTKKETLGYVLEERRTTNANYFTTSKKWKNRQKVQI